MNPSPLDRLIEGVNQLQDLFSLLDVSPDSEVFLPQLVVIGSQSSGKSSVLEAIVQRDFLPRGRDIVTRRPIVLQLITSKEEFVEFLHLPGERFTDFDLVCQEIERDTLRIAGPNKGIATLPINVRIHSSRLPHLTLVDLPGITKIPIGDQPSDIEEQVRSLCIHYVSNPNALILAVTPANADIANSEALKIARQVDLHGERTIAVLTKLDLMDAGTHAMDVLTGRSGYRMRFPFIPVVCRSQQDLNQRKSIELTVEHEREYFQMHPQYRKIAERCGSSYLQRYLVQRLGAHVQRCVPSLQERLNRLATKQRARLAEYGAAEEECADDADRGALILRFITNFTADFVDAIEGSARRISSQPFGGAKISTLFHDSLCSSFSTATSGLSLSDARSALRNCTGTKVSLFVPEGAFDALVRDQIKNLQVPSMRCVEGVHHELQSVLKVIATEPKQLQRFPKLASRLQQTASELVAESLPRTFQMVQSLIDIELAYLNTKHPDFIRTAAAFSSAAISKGKALDRKPVQPAAPSPHTDGFLALFRGRVSSVANSAPVDDDLSRLMLSPTEPESFSEREDCQANLIFTLVQSYVAVVLKNLQDSIPKAIMHCMVNWSQEHLTGRLISAWYQQPQFLLLLEQDEAVVKERNQCMQLLEAYKEASEILAQLSSQNFIEK